MDHPLMSPSDVLYSQNLQKYLLLFSELLSSPLPSPSDITSIIIDDHTTAVPTALALSACVVAKTQPTKTDRVLETVQAALDHDGVREVVIVDDVDHVPEEVFYVFEREFGERVGEDIFSVPLHRREDSEMDVEEEEEHDAQGANEDSSVLKATLVQSFAARLGLTDSLHHIHIAMQGLELEDSDSGEDPKSREVVATAALVVFLTLGAADAARAMAAEGGSYGGVFDALMNVRRSGVLKSWAALSALDRVILNVEGQTNERRSAEEVWRALFP